MGFAFSVVFLLSFTSGVAGHSDWKGRDSVALSVGVGLKTYGRREMLVRGHWYLLTANIWLV